MSDLLRGASPKTDSDQEVWSPTDQLLVALDATGSVVNPSVVSLALGMNLSLTRMPAFISARWLADATLLVPASGGVPLRVGRLKVMPVFTDAEALRAWLPTTRSIDHPCFGPPPDGVRLISPAGLAALREEAGAVMMFLNPAGPGGYQVDPEDGTLDAVEAGDGDGATHPPATPGTTPESPAPTLGGPPRPVGGDDFALGGPPAVVVPPPALGLIDPSGRLRLRQRIDLAMEQALALEAAGRDAEAVGLLAAADRLAELMGDYLHRAEMMVAAARMLERAGRTDAAGRLAHYAVLASSLCARARLEMEAVQLQARLQ